MSKDLDSFGKSFGWVQDSDYPIKYIDRPDAAVQIHLQLGNLVSRIDVLNALNTEPGKIMQASSIQPALVSKYPISKGVVFEFTPAQVRKILFGKLKLPVDTISHEEVVEVVDERQEAYPQISTRLQILNRLKEKAVQGLPPKFTPEDAELLEKKRIKTKYGSESVTSFKAEIAKKAAVLNVCDVAPLRFYQGKYCPNASQLFHDWSAEFIASKYGEERVSQQFVGLNGDYAIDFNNENTFLDFAGGYSDVVASLGLTKAVEIVRNLKGKGIDIYTFITLGPYIVKEDAYVLRKQLLKLADECALVGMYEIPGSEFTGNILSSGSQPLPTNLRTASIPVLKGIYPALLRTFSQDTNY